MNLEDFSPTNLLVVMKARESKYKNSERVFFVGDSAHRLEHCFAGSHLWHFGTHEVDSWWLEIAFPYGG